MFKAKNFKILIQKTHTTNNQFRNAKRFCSNEPPSMVETFLLVKNGLRKDMPKQGWKLSEHPSLTSSLCKLQGITSCYGTSSYNKNIFKIKVNGKDAGTVMKPNLSVMLEAAKPAPFGKGEETLYDDNIRKGLEINKEELQINDSYYFGLIPEDVQNLAPINYVLEPQLYKMHIYQPGGHFDFHRDTPHATNHLATFITTLPCQFKGGNLILIDHHQKQSFSLGSGEETGNCHWVAFYTDVLHKVEPVTEGTRVVLQFDLLARPKLDREYSELIETQDDMKFSHRTVEKDSESLVELSTELRKELENNPNQRFALALKHRYPQKSLQPQWLKNVDQTLWKHLEGSFEISLEPALIHGIGERDYICEYYVTPFDINEIIKRPKKRRIEENEKDLPPTWLVSGSRQSENYQLDSVKLEEYLGNEVISNEDQYLVSCIVVHKIK